MNIISHWIAQYRARRQHRRLVEEARRDWRVVAQKRDDFRRIDTNLFAASLAYVAEENGVGERRIRIVAPQDKYMASALAEKSDSFANWKLWEAKAQRKSIPMKEIA